jgi:hypothetical protein
MPAIKLRTFNGIMPKVDPRLLPDTSAQTAQNCVLHSGNLVPLKSSTLVQAATLNHKSLFLWRNRQKTPIAETWRSWAESVNIIGSPVADDAYSRYFYSGAADGKLKVYGSFNAGEGEERDVSTATPSVANLKCTGTYRPDPSTWELARYINATDTPVESTIAASFQAAVNEGLGCTYVSHEWTDTGVKVKWRVPSYSTQVVSTFFTEPHFFLKIGTSYLPSVWGETKKTTFMFSCGESIEMSDSAGKFADLKPVSWESDNPASYTSGLTPPPAVYSFPGFDLTIEFKFNYLQQFDLYYYYLFTFVDDTGVEGPPSDLSDFITREPGKAITITNIPKDTTVGTKTAARRIYRSAAGSQEDNFLFLAEISDNTTQTYVDVAEDSELGEALDVYGNPPDSMSGLVLLACGSAAAFKGKDVYLTRPYHLHVWPSSYNFVAGYDVVALAALGNDLFVLTTGYPEVISGSHPEFMSVRKLDLPQSCVSARSVATVAGMVVYASPDGLVGIGPGGMRILTEKHYAREEWQALTPSGMVGVVHDNRYYGFLSTGGIIVDFSNGMEITTHDETVTGAYSDIEDDKLYIIKVGNIRSWGDSTNKAMTWKSKKIQLGTNTTFSSARVIADTFTAVSLKFYGDGVLLATVSASDDLAFRLPEMRPEKTWEVELVASSPVKEIHFGTSMESLK